MEKPRDKYDEEIAYLTANADIIKTNWVNASPLFQYAGDIEKDEIGCLTMIRRTTKIAATKELTEAIRKDKRIPLHPDNITVEDLPVFAEWQRRLDVALNRSEAP